MWIRRQKYEALEHKLLHSEYRENNLNDLIFKLDARIRELELTEDNETKTEEKEMTYDKWVIFYKDGSRMMINAYDFNWSDTDGTLSFTDDDDNMIACFKLDKVDGVAMVQNDVTIGLVEAPITQVPAPTIKEVEAPEKPLIITYPNTDPICVPNPWTPSDPWWQQPQITTWNDANVASQQKEA